MFMFGFVLNCIFVFDLILICIELLLCVEESFIGVVDASLYFVDLAWMFSFGRPCAATDTACILCGFIVVRVGCFV